jgi:3-deoxy-D-manno-octulosonate 8-phosphate phosphatase (KDO 8-P phosphatase)
MDLANIKAVAFDVIGVIFSATVTYDEKNGEVARTRSHVDGQGITLLRAVGIPIVFLTAGGEGFIRPLVNRFNNLPSAKEGLLTSVDLYSGITGEEKTKALKQWLEEKKIRLSECLYMGDDVGDYDAMQHVGFRAIPNDAQQILTNKQIAFPTNHPGGAGAVRELCNLILEAKGADITKLPFK